MPIQFRCFRCNQAMSIATRKAGTQITCPKCSMTQTVPQQSNLQKRAPQTANTATRAQSPHTISAATTTSTPPTANPATYTNHTPTPTMTTANSGTGTSSKPQSSDGQRIAMVMGALGGGLLLVFLLAIGLVLFAPAKSDVKDEPKIAEGNDSNAIDKEEKKPKTNIEKNESTPANTGDKNNPPSIKENTDPDSNKPAQQTKTNTDKVKQQPETNNGKDPDDKGTKTVLVKTGANDNVLTSIEGISGELTYTTYFFTPTEAIIHGFEDDTKVRIISMKDKSTVYEGVIGRLQTKLIKTGRGVFAFIANKKASILVGTPTSCAVVGYWLRDQDGGFRSDYLFSQTPSSSGSKDSRIVVWAWQDVKVNIIDHTTSTKLASDVEIKAGKYYELHDRALDGIDSHVVSFQADKKAISVQIYYDEGFPVPSENGTGAGQLFYTYVGTITQGENDLNLISYYEKAKVRVEDVNTGAEIWQGEIDPKSIRTITLKGRHVKITSNIDICCQVAPYEHYKSGYAEHHFGTGGEGSGIANEFLITTPQELWVFSYYPENDINVTDAKTGKQIWSGKLGEGESHNVNPGHGFYRVTSSKGVSTMGGYHTCGCQFSSATNQFAVDEAVFGAVQQIREKRQDQAKLKGKKLTEKELNAPLTQAELEQANRSVQSETGNSRYTEAELLDRLKSLQRSKK